MKVRKRLFATKRQLDALHLWRLASRKRWFKDTTYQDECNHLKGIGLYNDNGHIYGTTLGYEINRQMRTRFDNYQNPKTLKRNKQIESIAKNI